MNTNILVTGATGNVGREVVRLLSVGDYPVAAAVRNLVQAQKNPGSNIHYVLFDFTNPDTNPDTFAGINKLFLVRPPAIDDIHKITPALNAAKQAGVEEIVFLSIIGADKNRIVPHYAIERAIEQLNIPAVFLRCSFFMQNLNTTHREDIRLRDRLFMPAGNGKTSFIDVREILSWYGSDNPGTLTNLARLLNHGQLAGTGKLVILPVDQGFEHGPARSFAANPPAYDPRYHFELTIEAGCNAYAAPLGFLEAGAREFAGEIPLILKVNDHDALLDEADPTQALTSSVEDALRLGCVAIGFTIYPGSAKRFEMYEQIRAYAAEAKRCGLVVVIWSYARGSGVSTAGETSIDVIAYAAQIAAQLGAHIIKVKLPTDLIEQQAAREVYQKMQIPIATPTERVRHVVQSTFNPGDKTAEAKFKDLNEANEVLSDPEKREKYDEFGQHWNQPRSTENPSSRGTNVSNEDFGQYGDFDSFINDLLGRRGRTSNRNPGVGFDDFGGGYRSQAPASDSEAAIALTFSEAFHGVQQRLQLDEDTINVRIPAGAKPGSRIRLKGKGRPSPFSQQRGDLYLTIEVLPHSFFRFEGDNLVCDVPIRPDEAVLGVEIKVPTPDGSVTMKVPKGVKSGQSLKLRGKGWTLPKGGRGDLFAKLQIVTPQDLNENVTKKSRQMPALTHGAD